MYMLLHDLWFIPMKAIILILGRLLLSAEQTDRWTYNNFTKDPCPIDLHAWFSAYRKYIRTYGAVFFNKLAIDITELQA